MDRTDGRAEDAAPCYAWPISRERTQKDTLVLGLEATPDHPIFSLIADDYVSVGDLEPGSELLSAKLSAVPVHHTETRRGRFDVCNLRVAGAGNYFAAAGAELPPILVHNGCFDRRKLQSVFDQHGEVWGFAGRKFHEAADEFESALLDHIKAADMIPGRYRGIFGKHYVDHATKKWVFLDENEKLVTGWELGREQYENLTQSGNVH